MTVSKRKQDRQCTYKYHWGALVQPSLRWKSNEYYLFWVCVCSRSYPACNEHAPYCHPRPIRLYQIFPHYLINGMIFGGRGGITEYKMRVLTFCTTFVRNISHSKKNSASEISKMYNGLHVQYPLFLSAFHETWIFLTDFSNTQISNFMKIRPVGAELFHVGAKTGHGPHSF